MFRYFNKNKILSILSEERAQLLTEVLVAIAVGGVIITAATAAIVSVIQQNYASRSSQTASSAGYDLMSRVKSYANSDWHNIYNLNHGTSSSYYIVSGATSSIAVSGQESLISNDVEAGLVGYWKFDEATGTIAYDYSNNGSPGSLKNSPTWATSSNCKVGACLQFDGSNSYVDAGANSITGTSPFTLSAWINTNTVSKYSGAVAIGNSSTGQAAYIGTVSTAQVGPSNSIGGGFYGKNYGTGVTSLNTWAYVVMTFTGGSGGAAKIYVDGVLKVTDSYTPNLGSNTVYFGKIASDTIYNFSGKIDDVRIYNRALSAGEIYQIYSSSVYSRYFYISNTSRDTNGNVVTIGGTDDPSTQKITVLATNSSGVITQFDDYLTRFKSAIWTQTDWSGGSGQDGPMTSITNLFSTSTNVTANNSLILSSTIASGNLISSIVDTQSLLGSAVNAVIWQGATNGGSVQFQLAYSNSSSGPWNYVGPTGAGSYYNGGPNATISVTNVNNYRYIRYNIFLNPSGGNSPNVTGVTLGWSP